VSSQRSLNWPGCYNARDLGGLPLIGGGETRWGQLIRSDAVDPKCAELVDYGVRTVIDLRNDDERQPGLESLHLPLDANEDREFWSVWESGWEFGTPLYYRPHLERHPERSAAVIHAIATAPPDAIVFHCGRGRDRAGQVSMLVLSLAGVEPEAIVEDYALSAERLPPDETQQIDRHLRARRTTLREVALDTLEAIDAEAVLRRGGATDADFEAIRGRLRP
jgi:protein-tyrosine phosphatase